MKRCWGHWREVEGHEIEIRPSRHLPGAEFAQRDDNRLAGQDSGRALDFGQGDLGKSADNLGGELGVGARGCFGAGDTGQEVYADAKRLLAMDPAGEIPWRPRSRSRATRLLALSPSGRASSTKKEGVQERVQRGGPTGEGASEFRRERHDANDHFEEAWLGQEEGLHLHAGRQVGEELAEPRERRVAGAGQLSRIQQARRQAGEQFPPPLRSGGGDMTVMPGPDHLGDRRGVAKPHSAEGGQGSSVRPRRR